MAKKRNRLTDIKLTNYRYNMVHNCTDVHCDRRSVLGNSFYMRTECMRDNVCDSYETWLQDQIIAGNERVCNELARILDKFTNFGEVTLFCWCVPKRCHTESIRNVIWDMYKLVTA